MRRCLTFSLVLVLAALVAGIVKVATRSRGSLARAAGTLGPLEGQAREGTRAEDRTADPPTRPRAGATRRAKLPAVERLAGGPGIATLHGRVRFAPPLERQVALGSVAVTASDRTRAITVDAGTDGRFSLHLPPGMYLLTASFGGQVGVRPDVLARAGVDREVDLELHEGATIAGRTRGAGDAEVVVTAAPTGDRRSVIGVSSVNGDGFSVDGLIPGRRYDLTFSGERVRTLKVAAVVAPAEDLEVTLSPLAILRGAIGFARGETCPIDEVQLLGPGAGQSGDDDSDRAGDDDGREAGQAGVVAATPDGACAFELPIPDGVTQATLIATGSGWRLEEPVAIPPAGDPAPLCLNPPCAPASEVTANVRVEVEGAPRGSGITAQLGPSLAMCGSTDSSCEFERIAIGAGLDVSATGDGCQTDVQHVVVAPGDNVVRLRCRPVPRALPILDVASTLRGSGDASGRVAQGGVEDRVDDSGEDSGDDGLEPGEVIEGVTE